MSERKNFISILNLVSLKWFWNFFWSKGESTGELEYDPAQSSLFRNCMTKYWNLPYIISWLLAGEIYGYSIATPWLHLQFSEKLRIWQVSACEMEPRSGTIITDWASQPASQPTSQPAVNLLCSFNVVRCPHPNCPPINKVCAVSPPQFFPSSTKYVRCPPLPVYIFSVRCPPPCSFLAFENLASSSL